MSGKLVKHKLHEEWGIGKIKNNPFTYNGKIEVNFENYRSSKSTGNILINPENLIHIGFYD